MKQFAAWHDRPMIMVALASGKRYAGNAAGMLQACGSYWASVRAAAQPLFHTSRSPLDSAHCNTPVSAACRPSQPCHCHWPAHVGWVTAIPIPWFTCIT